MLIPIKSILYGIPVTMCCSRSLRSHVQLKIWRYQAAIFYPVSIKPNINEFAKNIPSSEIRSLQCKNPYYQDEQKIFLLGKCYQIMFFDNEDKADIEYSLDEKHLVFSIFYSHKLVSNEEAIEKAIDCFSCKTISAQFNKIFIKHYQNSVLLPTVVIKRVENKWGMCRREIATNDILITINTNLVHYPPKYMKYIIHHEIVHIKHNNHGNKFWTLVGDKVPDCQLLKKKLNNYHFYEYYQSADSDYHKW